MMLTNFGKAGNSMGIETAEIQQHLVYHELGLSWWKHWSMRCKENRLVVSTIVTIGLSENGDAPNRSSCRK
jgi:hypothetical protein